MYRDIQQIHLNNVRLFSRYREVECELLDSLQTFDASRGYLKMGFSSLFRYCLDGLGMSEGQACTFIRVARKSEEVPELKKALVDGEVSTSNAKVIAPLLDNENKEHWLDKAKSLPKAELEREVARVNPKAAKPDRVKPLNEKQSLGQFVLSDKAVEILKRVQDLESQRTSSSCDVDAAVIAMGEAYLAKRDPVLRARRSSVRRRSEPKNSTRGEVVSKRTAPGDGNSRRSRTIPASVLRQVHLRDGGRCQVSGCLDRRFIQVHHIVPFSRGGAHRLDNLVSLCAGHHRSLHLVA